MDFGTDLNASLKEKLNPTSSTFSELIFGSVSLTFKLFVIIVLIALDVNEYATMLAKRGFAKQGNVKKHCVFQ